MCSLSSTGVSVVICVCVPLVIWVCVDSGIRGGGGGVKRGLKLD